MSKPTPSPSSTPPISRSPLVQSARLGLALALLVGVGASPREAAATTIPVASDVAIAQDQNQDQNPDRVRRRAKPEPLKKGPYGEIAWRPALGIFHDGVVPQMRLSTSLGARLNTRFKLAVHPHVNVLLDRPKASGVGIDMLATLYPWQRLFVRAGLGVISAAPYMRGDTTSRPGYGGFVGLGYDWNLKKKLKMGVGADLDVRWLKDSTPRMTLISGVHFWFG